MPFVICDYGPIEANSVPAACVDRPGLCYPGIYETVLLEDGKLVDWEDHWLRFVNGCGLCQINTDPKVFQRAVMDHIPSFGTRSRLRLMAFDRPVELKNGTTRFMAAAWPADLPEPTKEFRCIIGRHHRSSLDVSYNLKRLGRGYIDDELAAARSAGYSDVLFLNDRKELCEGSYSNVFVVTGEAVITSPLDSPCLPGITRAHVISAAAQHGITVNIEPISLDTLSQAREIFLTSSIRGLTSVTHLEGVADLSLKRPVRTLLAASIAHQ